jgi:hypothetical protein
MRIYLEHDPESTSSGRDPIGGHRFSLATNAEPVCAEIMREKSRRSAITIDLNLWRYGKTLALVERNALSTEGKRWFAER